MIKPIIIDFQNCRVDRQKINNLLAYNSILNDDLSSNINNKEFDRILSELEISKKELLDKCKNDHITCMILAGRVSINASRQGTKDEILQISTCDITATKCNINLKKLSPTEFRPTKSGKIISEKEMKKQKILKSECLKSFDAKISGLINGWLFAKVVFGDGGHQDNVFEESRVVCEWILKYGKKDEYFFMLIDTNMKNKIDELKLKYKNLNNIIIGNHIEIQQYFINNFYKES